MSQYWASMARFGDPNKAGVRKREKLKKILFVCFFFVLKKILIIFS